LPVSGTGTIRVGIGGWVFPAWRGTFYPKGLAQAQELAHASRHVTAIEINGTFYRLQNPATYRKWRDQAPENFVFSLKAPRFITHRNELAGVGAYLDRFFASGLLELGDKLGPILWQFAPTHAFDEADFAAFVALLPTSLENLRLRHVVEVRHDSFRTAEFAAVLRRHNTAVALVDDVKYPAIDEATGDFTYARLRRSKQAEPTGYAAEALDAWAERFAAAAAEGRDCFIYFINGAKVRAPAAAQALIERLAR
jgi:uncharacterized protein YecE (DUF72 family)